MRRTSLLIYGWTLFCAICLARGVIGVALTDASGGGALVGTVQSGAPADTSGLKAGDVVVAVNGTPVDRAATMVRIITALGSNQAARLKVIRGQKTIEVVIPAETRTPSSAELIAAVPVTAYTRLTDPIEQAFTIDVPSGWRSEGGLARLAIIQINPYVRTLSPDKMTYLMMGEPGMPSFAPPSEVGLKLGFREGTLYSPGLGQQVLIMHFLSGAELARRYGQTALGSVCPALKFVSSLERPEIAQKVNQAVPTVIPSRVSGGEARFTCTHNRQEMDASVVAVTRITRDNVGWAVIGLFAYITPKGQAERAQTLLQHIANSIHWSDAWVQKQSQLSRQAGEAIKQRIAGFERQQAAFIQKLNSVDQNFESMDELITGYSHYRDDRTGQDYYLNNLNPNKWIDDSGRITGTPDNNKPPWGSTDRPLKRLPQ